MSTTPTTRYDKMRQKCARILNDDFMDNVRMAQLVTEKPFLGLVITQDDQVYAVHGSADNLNMYGLPTDDCEKYNVVESLCGKSIQSFAVGEDHLLALSAAGVVYALGRNSKGQLGDDTLSSSVREEAIAVGGDLHNQVVVQIACGTLFSLALTEDGKVFTWGSNVQGRTGQGVVSGNTKLPKLVQRLTAHYIKYVTCGDLYTICLSDKGRLYAFGLNTHGTLGTGDSSAHSAYPSRVRIPDHHLIEKVKACDTHAVALTNNGLLYGWGRGDSSQLGYVSRLLSEPDSTTVKPKQITSFYTGSGGGDLERRMMEIEVEDGVTFAVDLKGTVHYWGAGQRCGPYLIHDVLFPNWNNQLQITTFRRNKVSNDMRKFFDDRDTSDLTIRVEEKDIHVHKAVLQIRSQFFRAMFDNNWKEARKKKIVIEDHTYVVYRAFLRYLYCGEIDNDLNQEQILELMDLATYALDEDLVKSCGTNIKKFLTFSNVARVFELMTRSNKTELSDYCIRFAMRGMGKVMDSDGFMNMAGEAMKTFLKKCREYGFLASETA